MASFNEVDSSGYCNASTVVGCELGSLSRDGTSVSFTYRAYIYQSSNTWSSNTFALWIEGAQNNVKGTSHSSQGTKYYTDWYSKTVSLDVWNSSCSVEIGVNGKQSSPSSPSGYVYPTLSGIPTCSAPSLSGLGVSSISDKSAYLAFSVTNNNYGSVYDGYIDLSLTNFGSVVKTISSSSGTFSGLDPNRTYYARGNAANAAGRSYTGVISFTTGFVNPGSPGKPSLSYDKTEPIPLSKITASWSAASAGSTSIAGYRVRLYKNGSEVAMVDMESSNISYTFPNTLESYGFTPGDVLKIGIYSYCKDWNGNKFFNGGGSSESQIYSDNLTIVSDKYIYVSVNGGTFTKYKMYISVNGGSFTEVKKEKFRII